MRWNGAAWTRVPSPSPGPNSYLLSVAAPAGSAWAVGYTDSPMRTLHGVERNVWTTGSRTPGRPATIFPGGVVAPGSAWAVGYNDSGGVISESLILRWDGTAWTTVPSPRPPTAT